VKLTATRTRASRPKAASPAAAAAQTSLWGEPVASGAPTGRTRASA
jgi:hypothetical protein